MTMPPTCRPARAAASLCVLGVLGATASAAETGATLAGNALPAGLETCAQLRVDAERLLCYDKFVAPKARGAAEAPQAAASGAATGATSAAAVAAAAPKASPDDASSFYDEYWELTTERKRGTFNFNGYRPNYLLPVHATNRINRRPSSPAPDHTGDLPDYKKYESKFQISLRTKVLEDVLLPNADLWVAYTQQSIWQLYAGGISRPFRATDHEPEAFYIVPTPVELPFGLRLKMVGVGIAHQSNGLTDPFSRSWNRWYVLGGIESGQFGLTARFNTRIHESDGRDDNPDFTKYRGRTELQALWTPGFYTLSAQAKTNFDSKRGSLQLDFTMPFSRKDPKGLRWYAQVFNGYGETLLDYNFRQTSIGAGIALLGW